MADRLGKYELRGVLGKGAMGTVYDGFDPIIARRVAIKTVALPEPDDAEGQDALSRFRREAQAAGRLSHPNIVGVFDYGETGEIAYIVMEFVEGNTLRHVMGQHEVFELPAVFRVMEGLMAGLKYSHERAVVHRDIKPANLMMTEQNEVKIADFGIARIESSSMTQAGTMLGTPSYMSPEQFMGQTVDARSDLYSSGVLLYQLLTGEKPFDGGLTAIMHKVLNTEPPRPSALSFRVTPALDAIVAKAMAKRPEERFASAAEFAAALRDAEAGGSNAAGFALQDGDFASGEATMVAARRPVAAAAPTPSFSAPAPRPGNSRNLLLAGGGAAALLVLAVVGFLVFGQHHPAATQAVAAASVPAPAPVPATPPPMSTADFNARLDALPCTLLTADTSAAPALDGVAGAGAPQAAVNGILASASAPIQYSRNVQTIDGPYCDVLDAVRPYAPLGLDPASRLALSTANGNTVLHEGDLITLDATMPGFGGYLQTDYFSSDGSVFHLYPTPTDRLQPLAAHAVKVLGDPAHGGASWGASAPFGTDLILSVASPQPLFASLRPQSETASAYLPALRAALRNAGSVAITVLPLTTLPKVTQ